MVANFWVGAKICPSSTLTARQTAVQVFFQAQAVRLSPTIACFRLLQVAKLQADGGQHSSILHRVAAASCLPSRQEQV